jgi:hypothetical protein
MNTQQYLHLPNIIIAAEEHVVQLANVKPYAVVEDAGMDSERVIKRFDSRDEADDYITERYTEEEVDELLVDVMGVQEDGCLTTEI